MANFNFEEYRQPWETGPHWELKREFLERYKDHFQEDRLLCLAQAYSNIQLLHCTYPLEVMKQVRELSQPLQGYKRFRGISSFSEQKNETQKGKRKLNNCESSKKYKFIKFCSSIDQQIMDEEESNDVSVANDGANVDYASIEQSSDIKIIQTLASEIQKQMPAKKTRSLQMIQSSLQSLKMENLLHLKLKYNTGENLNDISNEKCYCELYIGTTLIAIGYGHDQESAEEKVAEDALQVLSNYERLPIKNLQQTQKELKNNTRIINKTVGETKDNEGENISLKSTSVTLNSEASQDVFLSFKKVQPDFAFLKTFAKELNNRKRRKKDTSLSMIYETAKRLKISELLLFNIVVDLNSPVHNPTFICDFSIKNISVSQGKGTSKKRARNQAADIGFNYLLELLKGNCSYPNIAEVENSEEIIEKDKYQQNNSNIKSVEKSNILKSVVNVTTSKSESKSNVSVELNDLNNKNCSSFDIETEDKKFINTFSKLNASKELLAKPFINKKLLENSLKKGFVLFDVTDCNQQTPGAIFNYSAQQCHKQYSFSYEEVEPSGIVKAALILDKNIIATGYGSTKTVAKQEATQSALEKLRKEVYTVKIKSDVGYVISRKSLFDKADHVSTVVSEDNIGCKMLKSMGWTGGGIGKTEGIKEPIKASDYRFGKGLGYSENSRKEKRKSFESKIESLLFKYSLSQETQPLIFSNEFSKLERKRIHRTANRYRNLVSKSHGKDEEHSRQLQIKHKLSVTELLNILLKAGGSTCNYELVDLSGENVKIFQ